MVPNKSDSMNLSWGEIPLREVHKQDVITPDVLENIWRQVLDDSNCIDCDYESDQQSGFIQLSPGDPHVFNTISCHQQLQTMENRLMRRGTFEMDAEDTCSTQKPINPFNFSCTNYERETVRKISRFHYLRPSTVRSFLKHSVIVLIAHIGYENATDIAIETITDVVDHFLTKISMLLKLAIEQKNCGFPDAVERLFVKFGIGGIADIYDYYQNYILQFEQRMRKEVEVMVDNQRQLEQNATTKIEMENTGNKLLFSEIDAFNTEYTREVPTLQLLDPNMGFTPSLNAGFQMLHNLEQNE